ncbi:MAG: efflux transporter outer membrane subunit [Hafnia alvei]|uniref:efflux transporter outer membrane subunit n=1 Tax=Hafnia alvei TaxID=569 RepID=UPI003F935FF4
MNKTNKKNHSIIPNKKLFRSSLLIALSFAIGGCAMIHSDKTPLPQTDLSQIHINDAPAGALRAWPGNHWWQNYHNPQLNQLVEQALADSPSLAVVRQRVEIAKAQTDRARADDLPIVNFSADVERQKMSAEGVMGPFALDDPAAGTTGPWYTNGTFGLQASYDLDLWGKNRAQVESALGVYKARQAELAESELLVSSAVTQIYWDIQTVKALQDILIEVKAQEAIIVDTDRELYSEGIISSLEQTETETQFTKIDEQIDASRGNLLLLRANLQALIGLKTPLPALKTVPLPDVISTLPQNLSYELLARRPDLQAAHWYIDASLSQVDAAKAAFYPDINLMGFLQNDALHLSDLFRGSAQQMGGIFGLTLPIFDGGRLNANLSIVQSDSNLNIASYNKAVVNAVTEVTKGITQIQTISDQSAHQTEVVDGDQKIWSLTQMRFQAGLISGVNVAKAKLPLLAEQSKLIELHGRWIDADINLTKSLGGGYRASGTSSKS